MGSRDEEAGQMLLAFLEWQDRTERWMRFPEPARAALVSELAGLMVRVASKEIADERQREDQPETS